MIEAGQSWWFVLGVPAELGGAGPRVEGVVERVTWLASGEPFAVRLEVKESEGFALELPPVVEIPWRAVWLLDQVVPECCSGPGGVFGCREHTPRRQISDRPQA